MISSPSMESKFTDKTLFREIVLIPLLLHFPLFHQNKKSIEKKRHLNENQNKSGY